MIIIIDTRPVNAEIRCLLIVRVGSLFSFTSARQVSVCLLPYAVAVAVAVLPARDEMEKPGEFWLKRELNF